MYTFKKFILAVSLMAGCIYVTAAQSPSGLCGKNRGCTVTGTVKDALGNNGVAGIRVRFGGRTAMTGKDGVYVIRHCRKNGSCHTLTLELEDRTARYEILPEELEQNATVNVPDFYSGYEMRDGVKIQKVGDLWKLIPEEIRANESGSVQGLAFDGDKMFIFHDMGGFALFDLSAMRYLYSGDVDPDNRYHLHCNEAFSGPGKLTAESEHHLIFVSECHSLFNIYVYDISSDKTTLVGTINPPDTIGERPELSWGISSYSYDAENGWIYGHNNNFIRRYRFPSLDEFTDGEYKMKAEDFLGECFFSPALTMPQGACAVGGKLYMPSGIYDTHRCCIYVYDFATGDTDVLDINDFGLEPEGTDYKDGWLYVAFNNSGKEVVYRFQF